MINVIQGLGHDGIYCHHDMLKNTQYLQKEKKNLYVWILSYEAV